MQQMSLLADMTGISSLSAMLDLGRSSVPRLQRNTSSASASPTPSEIMADDLYDCSLPHGTTEKSSAMRPISVSSPTESKKLVCAINKLKTSREENDQRVTSAKSSSSGCLSPTRSSKISPGSSLRLSQLGSIAGSFDAREGSEVDLEQLFLELIRTEKEFISTMYKGVLKFSRPLRHGLLSPHEHNILFQNVEKLLAISRLHLKRLGEACGTRLGGNTCPVGGIYLAQISVLCEAYLTYFRGLADAEKILASLLRRNRFVQFLNQNVENGPKIHLDTFLHAPQLHLQNLVSLMDNMIVVVAPLQDPGFKSLLHVQKGM